MNAEGKKRKAAPVVDTVGPPRPPAGPGACVMIPAGTRHQVEPPGAAPLFGLTVYAPPVC